jgi:tungstate transport system substrate-binding protein
MKRFATLALSLLALSIATPAMANPPEADKLVLATTTSTMDSGLLDFLVPVFAKENGCKVQIIAVGTGAAIRYGKDGNADVVLVHDPVAEAQVVKHGFFVERKYLMYNDFVIVGPAGDPAGIKGLASATEALKMIEASRATFVSRADQSGTHKKEQRLWEAAGIKPKGSWYLEAGAGMEAILRIANEKRAYSLTDRGTYLAHQKEYDLPILNDGDNELFNPYHIMLVAPAKHPFVNYSLAKKFSDFLTSERGRKMIAEYGVDKYGQPLFYPAAEKK